MLDLVRNPEDRISTLLLIFKFFRIIYKIRRVSLTEGVTLIKSYNLQQYMNLIMKYKILDKILFFILKFRVLCCQYLVSVNAISEVVILATYKLKGSSMSIQWSSCFKDFQYF